MRTTIRLDDELLAAAKAYAARTGQTLTAVVEEALRRRLAEQSRPDRQPPVRLATVGGRGPGPGIDLDHSASLLEHLEEPN